MLRSRRFVAPDGQHIDPNPGGPSAEDLQQRRKSAPVRQFGMYGGVIINPRWIACAGEANPYELPNGKSLFPTALHFLHDDGGFADLRGFFDFVGITAPFEESALSGFVEVELPEGYCVDPNGFFIGDHRHGSPLRSAFAARRIPGMEMDWMSGIHLGIEEKLRSWIDTSLWSLPAWLEWKGIALPA